MQLVSSQARGTILIPFLSIRIERDLPVLVILLLLDFGVPVEENGFQRSNLVLFLFVLFSDLCSPLGVTGLVIGGDEELGICLADGVTLARMVVFLIEGLLLIELLGVEVGVVAQVRVLLLFRSRGMVKSRERHILISIQLDFILII